MPDPETVRTDNPEVVRLLIAHQVAMLNAPASDDTVDKGARVDVEKYLAVFGAVYKGIGAPAAPPSPTAP